jgi:hypothetical protein
MNSRIIAAIAVITGLAPIGSKPDNDNATAASQRGPAVLGFVPALARAAPNKELTKCGVALGINADEYR